MPGIKKNSIRAKLFPELRRFANDSDRFSAFKPALNEVLNSGLSICLITAVVAVTFVGIVILEGVAQTPLDEVAVNLSFLVLVPASQMLIFWVLRSRIRRELRRKLNTYGIPICIKCAYDLRGNESGICPECGTRAPQQTGLYCIEKPKNP